jgi:hypothetical protein
MSNIPLHLQRRFEQRWAARFGSPVNPAGPKNVEGLAGQHAPRPEKAKEKRAGLRRKAEGK